MIAKFYVPNLGRFNRFTLMLRTVWFVGFGPARCSRSGFFWKNWCGDWCLELGFVALTRWKDHDTGETPPDDWNPAVLR